MDLISCQRSLPVRKQVDCGSATRHNRYGFPATGTYNVPREGIHPHNSVKAQIDFCYCVSRTHPLPPSVFAGAKSRQERYTDQNGRRLFLSDYYMCVPFFLEHGCFFNYIVAGVLAIWDND